MTSPERNTSAHDEPAIPPGLASALRRLEASPGDLRALDERVLPAARGRIRGRRRGHRRWLAFGSAAAAAILLASAGVFWFNHPSGTPSPLARNAPPPITILKAFELARLLNQQGNGAPVPIDPVWDANADGQIDRTDVDTLAARAVQLSDAGRADKARIGGGT